jgi:hypothetical protein
LEEGEIMTIDEQAANLEVSYGTYHRQMSQTWRTPDDRREALNALTSQLREAERTLRLPETSDTASGRSKLILWTELTRAMVEEQGARR